MYIIGTSGHIDHGKTSLIHALTGVDCDRLPEEKARAMTIDIGFAGIDLPKFGTVSIIDVPGHERFIRNMVAGAWGIDLALLVVAADDSWMPQTEDHFRVLQLLGIERIIVVLNKVDLADEEMLDLVIDEVRTRLQGTVHESADIVPVSARTGLGIDHLKETIVANLKKLAKARDAGKPYLFVDRVFASRGHGTVITGTLKNGHFAEEDTVTVLPGNIEARIKRIESHKKAQTEGDPSQRTALNLSGVSVDDMTRGNIIVRDNFFSMSDDLLAEIAFTGLDVTGRTNVSVEILAGTADIKGKLILPERRGESMLCRVRLEKPWYFYPGQNFVLTSPGGFRIIGGGTVVFPSYSARKYRKRLSGIEFSGRTSREDILRFHILLERWIAQSDLLSRFQDDTRSLQRIIDKLTAEKTVLCAGPYIFDSVFYADSLDILRRTVTSKVGPNLSELAFQADIPADVAKLFMDVILSDGLFVEREGRFFGGDSLSEENLPDAKKKVMMIALERGFDGIELDREKNETVKRDVGDLIRLGFLISLDGVIVYHRDVYEDARNRVMGLFALRDRITVADAKDAVPLSRKYMIPLLNRIERDGLLKRVGDYRIKA